MLLGLGLSVERFPSLTLVMEGKSNPAPDRAISLQLSLKRLVEVMTAVNGPEHRYPHRLHDRRQSFGPLCTFAFGPGVSDLLHTSCRRHIGERISRA